MKSQTVPQDADEAGIRSYAEDFFGYGSPEADYWIIGLEERGCTARADEFTRRYRTWNQWAKSTSKSGLVDLSGFTTMCKEGTSDWKFPDWGNRTWRKLRKVLQSAGIETGETDDQNHIWGGSYEVRRGSGHIALIETMPFAAPSRRPEDWPYAEWKWNFMKSREACEREFLSKRRSRICELIKDKRPWAVVDFGKIWSCARDPFSHPVLIRKHETNSTLWIAPVKVSGAIHVDSEAGNQLAQQLRRFLDSRPL